MILISTVAAILLVSLAVGLLALTLVFAVEIAASSFLKPDIRSGLPPESMTVIVPAHNESSHIAPMIRALQLELRPADAILVVADNCTDDTYAVAEAAGARVVRREDPARRGKGYALDYALRELAKCPPDAVVVMDADCYASPGSLLKLATVACARNRPVQAQYDMIHPGADNQSLHISAFSYKVKAWVRPTGLRALGLPCGLMGTGMALPWKIASGARLASSHLVEDLQLSLQLACDGFAPEYCTDAKITSTFPVSLQGQQIQRERWETGHLRLILELVPAMIWRGLRTGNIPLLALAVDTAIPPLALLTLLIAAETLAGVILYCVGGSALPFGIGLATCGLLLSSILAAWRIAFPGESIGTMVLRVPDYVLGKFGLYVRALAGKRIEWVRSPRD